jgi:CubicO group peptidase (beta-lactamase class C family)
MPFESIDTMMRQAVENTIFPGGGLIFSKAGRVLFNEVYGCSNVFTKRPVTPNTLFDLASLTKPLATALAILSLVQHGKIRLDQTLGEIIGRFRNTPKENIRICDLLRHNSGLPDYQPYYMEIGHAPHSESKAALRMRLVQEPLTSGVGQATLYSDIGFMILEWVIETIVGESMALYLDQAVYHPLEVGNLFYVKPGMIQPEMNFAATEVCAWRGRLIHGEVHDENAYATGGVAGHAGLFGTTESVHHLLLQLMDFYNGSNRHALFQQDLVRLFLTPPLNAQRALGFDVPSEAASSSGNLFKKDRTVGHLGFTGTSFWMDLHQSVIVVLLTNRIHPTRTNEKIKNFRPMIHDAIMSAILTGSVS